MCFRGALSAADEGKGCTVKTSDLETKGKTGWHIHLSKLSGTWELRRKGRGEPPIDATAFVM
jgi:hypothetical protein